MVPQEQNLQKICKIVLRNCPLFPQPCYIKNKKTLKTLKNPRIPTPNSYPSMTGKIARLPHKIREQINRRLQDGEPGRLLLAWLNALPQTLRLLTDQFGGRPVNQANLSAWRNGGFRPFPPPPPPPPFFFFFSPPPPPPPPPPSPSHLPHAHPRIAARYAVMLPPRTPLTNASPPVARPAPPLPWSSSASAAANKPQPASNSPASNWTGNCHKSACRPRAPTRRSPMNPSLPWFAKPATRVPARQWWPSARTSCAFKLHVHHNCFLGF